MRLKVLKQRTLSLRIYEGRRLQSGKETLKNLESHLFPQESCSFLYLLASNGQNLIQKLRPDDLTLTRTMDKKEQTFSQLVREQKSTIYTVCYMFSQNQDEVNDLFQEVLVNLWRGFEGFEGRSDVRTWVYRVALNTCISLDRKRRSRPTLPLSMDINLFEDRDTDTQQVDMLHRRISRLRPFDRAIVLLWLEDLSYEEIGQIVGISEKNVSVRLFRIKEQLKRMSNS